MCQNKKRTHDVFNMNNGCLFDKKVSELKVCFDAFMIQGSFSKMPYKLRGGFFLP